MASYGNPLSVLFQVALRASEAAARPARRSATLYLIRHAQSESNRDKDHLHNGRHLHVPLSAALGAPPRPKKLFSHAHGQNRFVTEGRPDLGGTEAKRKALG